MIRKQLSLLLLIVILLVPGLHKVMDQIPPNWFLGKFESSLIGKIPGGIVVSYYVIIALEFIGPVLLLIALFRMGQKKAYQRYLTLGFLTCYMLFLTLTFGSFLVQDYDNGFKDFIYFVGILVIENLLFSAKKADVDVV